MILCDIDGTIAATAELLQSRHATSIEKYPVLLPKGFWTSQGGYEIYRDVEPLPGALDAINVIDQVDKLCYFTIRSPEMKFITLRWMQKHGFPLRTVLFCENLNEKSDVAKDASLAFDDDPQASSLYQCRLILIARPYNTGGTTWEQVIREGGLVRTRKPH
jgi:uncharacterized HAD superfamily protein